MKQVSNKLFRAPSALLVALGLTGGQAFADIVGSAHDFSNSGFSGNEICVVCHTTHNADTTVTEAPLWNHELTSQTFSMYSSPTMDAAQDAQPTGSSKLCLSCHDGATAIDAYGGNGVSPCSDRYAKIDRWGRRRICYRI